ncbi:MAG: c-type cytochrome [Pseudorhodoplanes sp.]|jgi:cytochrome c553|nr:c-type cytochrome [Pseudorhodoplanes sp.]
MHAAGRMLFLAGLLFWPAIPQAAEPPRIVRVCASCHGLDGVGQNVDIPNIAGQSGIYLKNQLRAFRNGQRRHPQMTISAEQLTDREIDQIVTHYALMPAR